MVSIKILHKERKKFLDSKSGFSLLINIDDQKILFDLSYGDEIKKKINGNVDFLVLSHGHIDHTDGMRFFDMKKIGKIVAHPDCFNKKFFKDEGEIGCPVSVGYCKSMTDVFLTKKPFKLFRDVVFLGEIPRLNDFEAKRPIGTSESGDDFVLDDSAIAINTKKGLIIITGCSHSGICNIVEYSKKLLGGKVYAVIGGFHLFGKEKVDRTVSYLKKNRIKEIYPMHCLSEYGFRELEKIGAKRVYSNQEIVI